MRFCGARPLGSSLTETSVELSYETHVLLPGQASNIQARFSFFDASAGYTAEILQEFLERVGSYHWAFLAPKGSCIFQEFINMLAVDPQHFCFDFDGCAFGSRTKRPSRFVSSASTFSALRWECSHAIPHTHAGKPDRHLNFSCTFWDTVAFGIAGALDGHGRGAVRRKPGQIHFNSFYVLSSAVLRDTSLLCGAFLVCDCTKLCICGSLINRRPLSSEPRTCQAPACP